MQILTTWYDTRFGENDGPKLVIVVDDFESFNPSVMEDLVDVLRFEVIPTKHEHAADVGFTVVMPSRFPCSSFCPSAPRPMRSTT